MVDLLFEDLRAELEQGQVVVMVGTGVSVGATANAKVASWTGMLEDGVNRCEQVAWPPVPDGWGDRLRAQIASGDLWELLSAADNITERLGGRIGGEYRRWLRETVGQLRAKDKALIAALRDLGGILATTNYDGLLEEDTDTPPVTWRQRELAQRVIRGDDPGVLHLHGYWQDPESVVLGIRSYEAVLGDRHAQAMQRALATTHTFLFVGFGEGLADPNFGALRRWMGELFGSGEYRHFRLAKRDQVAKLQAQHTQDERVYVLDYGEHHDDLAPYLRSLAPPKPGSGRAPSSASTLPARLPPRPRCFGRDEIVEDLVETLLAAPPPPTPVLGPGGIGKSTVCVAALHDPRVVDRYGQRRYFVRCHRASSGEGVLHEVATTLGLPVSPELGAQTLAILGEAPAVLVLDNAETPWWADPEGTEATLAQLAAVPGLCLVASLRGRQRPFGLAWRDPITVPPLATADNRKVFLAVAGQDFEDDPRLDDLVMAQDGLPLTTELLAYLAEGEPDLAGLWRQWTEQRVALLTPGSRCPSTCQSTASARLRRPAGCCRCLASCPMASPTTTSASCCREPARQPPPPCARWGSPSMRLRGCVCCSLSASTSGPGTRPSPATSTTPLPTTVTLLNGLVGRSGVQVAPRRAAACLPSEPIWRPCSASVSNNRTLGLRSVPPLRCATSSASPASVRRDCWRQPLTPPATSVILGSKHRRCLLSALLPGSVPT
jgi:hypothetical protein